MPNNEPKTLITLLVGDGRDKPEGLGALPYASHPRIGEWVELSRDSKGIMCEVVMIAHSTTGGESDVYVRELGPIAEVIQNFQKQFQTKRPMWGT